MTTFIYGYDPICGWCYGAAPAVRAVAQIMPVRVVMAGLVTGDRVGPAARMVDYVRNAAIRLEQVTGRAPSPAFYDWMVSTDAIAASAPPAVAVHAVQQARPEATLSFANAVTEAHYANGMDPNDTAAYAPLLAKHAPGVTLPDLHDPDLADAAFAAGRALGISAFPTFMLEDDNGTMHGVPSIYDPDELIAAIRVAN